MTTTQSRLETVETAADGGRRTWPWPAILLTVLAAAPVLSMIVEVVRSPRLNYLDYWSVLGLASYPTGQNGTPMSAVSQALQSCATSPSFYFQASDDTTIATGFIQLFNSFAGQYVHITQ